MGTPVRRPQIKIETLVDCPRLILLAEIGAHLLPDVLLITAAVGELVRLQDEGLRLVVNH